MLKLRKKPAPGELLLKEVKIIDFGSSFLFTNLKQFSMATPEYMPPEILNYILFQNGLEYDAAQLKLI
jgi:dual specificity tyrosine-phosphorylation-regulated kinase 2/3/4